MIKIVFKNGCICKWKQNADKKEDLELICRQVYDLALMSHKTLSSEEMTAFIDRSNLLLEKLACLED